MIPSLFSLLLALIDEGVIAQFSRDFGDQTGTVLLTAESKMFSHMNTNQTILPSNTTHFHFDGEDDLVAYLMRYLKAAQEFHKKADER